MSLKKQGQEDKLLSSFLFWDLIVAEILEISHVLYSIEMHITQLKNWSNNFKRKLLTVSELFYHQIYQTQRNYNFLASLGIPLGEVLYF